MRDPGKEDAVTKARFAALCSRGSLLQAELHKAQNLHKSAFEAQGRQFSDLLTDALCCFENVLVQVNEFDDKLIQWYLETKSRKSLQLILRPSKNKQRRLDNAALLAESATQMTDSIRVALFSLERRFQQLGELLHTSYRRAEVFQDKLEEFSSSRVGATMREAQALLKHYQNVCEAQQHVLDDCEAEVSKANAVLRVADTAFKRAARDRQAAETKARVLGGTSLATAFGGGMATVALMATAPVTLPVVLGGAAILGGSIGLAALQGHTASESSDKAAELQVEESQRATKVCEAEGAVAELAPTFNTLQLEYSEVYATKLVVEDVAAQSLQIRVDAQALSQEMRAASMTLSACEGTARLTAIALEDAGFAASRMELTSRLGAMLKQIRELGEVQQIILDQEAAEKVSMQLRALEEPSRVAALKDVMRTPE